jgi:hypothetical protein
MVVVVFGPRDLGAQRDELGVRKRVLDQREEDILLVTDVSLQTVSQLVQRVEPGRVVALDVLCPAAQVHVLDEHAQDRFVVRRPAASVGGQQQFLLDGEVPPAVLPEVQEGRPRLGCVGRRRAPQLQRGEQALMVVARERRELLASLHPGDASAC